MWQTEKGGGWLQVVLGVLMACAAALTPCKTHAADVKVAIAANFTEPAKEIAAAFEKVSGHKLIMSFGATGQFYAQIAQGAPFDILLAADPATPKKAIAENLGVVGSSYTYATGQLVLYSRDNNRIKGEATLKDGNFTKLALANPEIAPYGAAAMQAMQALGVLDTLKPKFVTGNSIAQTYQFIETGNAEVGFVALSQVIASDAGSRWIVPAKLHAPIAQDAVLLKSAGNEAAARSFLEFLRGPEARAVITKFGYGTDG